MVRDMSLNVRINAFNALGNVGVVSDYILLQTLSKRIDKELPRRLSVKHFNLPISTGAFVHGLEDEFCEVRSSACYSIRIPVISSATCAAGALDLLMDVLNDDSAIVRLQALQTMHHMAVLGHLKVQEMHMHMFLGTLADMNASIRITARKVLRLTKLHDLPLFELVADSLIQSLESYPQDEPDVLSLMFDMGRSHGSFAVSIAKEIFSEIEPSSESNWDFNSSKNAAQLALAISAPLSHRKQRQLYIPATIFSYAVTMLGRISNGLTGTMDQDTLLAYLSHCSTSTVVDPTELTEGEDKVVQMVEDDLPKEMDSLIAITHVVDKREVHGKTRDYVKFILDNTAEVWPLIKSGCINEVLMTVRSWKEELATYITYSYQSNSVLAFALQYLHVVKLLSKAWSHVMCPINSMHNIMSGDLGYIMQKLERRLAEFKYRFTGLSEEEELHIEELTLVACSLRLSLFDAYLQESALKKMISTKSRLLFLYKETSAEPSRFVTELKEILQKNESDIFRFRESLELFTLKKLVFTGNFQYMKAEVDIRDNNWSNPLPFVAGLPVGIPLNIRLHNIPIGTKLWLMLKLSKEVNQHVFLDLKQFEGSEKIREFTFIAPFYRTPKVNSFILRLQNFRNKTSPILRKQRNMYFGKEGYGEAGKKPSCGDEKLY
ncbi:protein SIEL isoform X1 [Tanacetum coccineum]